VARLDPLIETLLCESGIELRLETGAAAQLALKAGVVSPVRKVLSTEQIRTFAAELAPEAVSPQVRDGAAHVSFSYTHPKGTVLVDVRPDGDRILVLVLPGPVSAAPTPTPPPPPNPAAAVSAPAPKKSVEAPAPPRAAPRRAPKARRPEPEDDEEEEDEDEGDAGNVIAMEPAPGTPAGVRTGPAAEAIDALLTAMLAKNASDLHLSTAHVPCFRIDGDVVQVSGAAAPTQQILTEMIYSLMAQRNRKEFERRNDTDFAHETPASRFRVNVFRDRVGIGAVIRQIPNKIRTVEELGLTKAIVDLCALPKGLVLVTGPTGSGKSTTLAAMIDHVNRTRSDHIITIEDPVEFVHPHKKCLVHQREVHIHTESFKSALRAALREDPDVVLVGELRDLETVAIAIETAETGHLVFGTLHTNTAPSTVDRVIDQFPADRQSQIRIMLSETLRAVITQTLVKKRGGGRIAVHEILIVNPAIANLIREAKTFQIPSMMQTGRNLGMVTQTDALFELVRSGKVEASEALNKAAAKADLRQMLEKIGL